MVERRTIEVGALARVEGEGALHLVLEGDRVVDLRLEIYEPPRFFEALARGRRADELPDLMARICGICPVAYQMSAVHAIEAAWGVELDPTVRALRRLYYAANGSRAICCTSCSSQRPTSSGSTTRWRSRVVTATTSSAR